MWKYERGVAAERERRRMTIRIRVSLEMKRRGPYHRRITLMTTNSWIRTKTRMIKERKISTKRSKRKIQLRNLLLKFVRFSSIFSGASTMRKVWFSLFKIDLR
jgi:hypothetical protein